MALRLRLSATSVGCRQCALPLLVSRWLEVAEDGSCVADNTTFRFIVMCGCPVLRDG